MKYSSTNKPIQCFMTQSACYKGTKKMTVKGILWHSTGVNNPWLKRYVQPDDNAPDRAKMIALIGKNAYNNDWNHIYREAGLNCWVGKLADGTVSTVQTMPWDYKPWGCGSGKNGSCNTNFIQFEICEDGLTDRKYFEAAYKEACEITAYLCQLYNIDPNGTVNINGVTVPTILCHQDSYQYGLGSNHSDIYNWFPKFGYNMTNVRKDVAALLKGAGVNTGSNIGGNTGSGSTTTTVFKKGDLVTITGTKYYSGSAIPSWVKAKNWYVESVSGTRVVINKSEDGKNAIMSPVKASDLKLANTSAPATQAPTTSEPVKPSTPKPSTPSTTIKAGDTVKITGSKYYSGATIASWVKAKDWIVHSVSGDRVVIDKSVDGQNSIMSPVKASDLAVVSATQAAKPVVNTTIETGDTVKIVGSKYYSGAVIPAWVKAKNWIVYSATAGNDRIVINKSTDGQNAIMSPIKRRDLQLVSKK